MVLLQSGTKAAEQQRITQNYSSKIHKVVSPCNTIILICEKSIFACSNNNNPFELKLCCALLNLHYVCFSNFALHHFLQDVKRKKHYHYPS